MKKLFKLFTLLSLLGMMGLNATAGTEGGGRIKNIRIREVTDGVGPVTYKIVVVVKHDDADQVNYVDVTVDPIGKSPEPSAKSFTLKENKKNANHFISSDLTFKTSALDFEYLVTATMYDEKGNKVGKPETDWVTVDAKGDGYEPDPCDSKMTMDGATITSTLDEKRTQTLNLKVPYKPIKLTNANIAAINFRNSQTGYIITSNATPKFNEKTGISEASYTFTNTSKENYWIPEVMDLRVTNACGDKFYFDAKPFNIINLGANSLAIEINGIFKKGTPDACSKPDIDSLYWEIGAYNKTTGTTPVFVYIPKNHIKNKGNGTVYFEFANTGSEPRISVTNSTNETQNAVMKLNEKTGWYECTVNFSKSEGGVEVTGLSVTLVNSCGDSSGFIGQVDKALKTGPGKFACQCRPGFKSDRKQNNTDSCNTKYKLKEIDYETSTAGGLYTMQFSFNFGNNSDAPSELMMAAQLTNCNGQTMNIKLKMYYNPNTNSYYCGQAIKQDRDCEWKLTYAEIGAYNPCKDFTWWGFDFSQIKSNGKGTRNTASTTEQTQPKLL